ncbi:MAG: hypothetical protein Q9216_002252 [Gyalolechia sp. 2 TL-2023]
MDWLGALASSFPYQQAYCPICGSALLKNDSKQGKFDEDDDEDFHPQAPHPPPQPWLQNFTYITINPINDCDYTIHNAYESTTSFSNTDIYVGTNTHSISRTPRLVVVNDRILQSGNSSYLDPSAYRQKGGARQYTVHAACVRLMARTFAQNANRYVNSVGDLYRALETQCWAETAYIGPRRNVFHEVYGIVAMRWSHGYFGAGSEQRVMASSSARRGFVGSSRFDADPEEVPGLTEYILSQLQPLSTSSSSSPPTKEKEATSLSSRIAALPQELQDMIPPQISWPMEDNPDPRPTRCGTPEFWMHALMTGKAVPWLWDLNQDMCMVKHHFRKPNESKDNDWDWELMVRQLSQVDVFDLGRLMGRAPGGLRNRRRIWRCCRELVPDTVAMEELKREKRLEYGGKKAAPSVNPEVRDATFQPSSSQSTRLDSGTSAAAVVDPSSSRSSDPQKKSSKRGLAGMLSRVKGLHF